MALGQGKDNTPAGDSDRVKMMRVLIPTVAIGAIVLLVAVITGMSDGSGKKMSDGSNGTVEDADLKELEPGVKYRDLKEGKGEACPRDAKVKINYTGWLVDGTVFDSTKDKNRGPADFDLKDLIPGWQIGIPGMKPGGIRKLVISPEKGYGSQSKSTIPGGSTLIFEVELISAAAPVDLTKLSDGTLPGADDPNLKEIVPGVKYRDLKEGSGAPCLKLANVTIHYTGWLTNGTQFDSSRKRGEPNTFSLAGLIQGWQVGIPGMKPGGIRKLVISPEMGYGSQPQKGIPANSTLVFEVELIKVN